MMAGLKQNIDPEIELADEDDEPSLPEITDEEAGEKPLGGLAAGRDVIVEGRLAGAGAISATQVMTSCPSKYQAKDSAAH